MTSSRLAPVIGDPALRRQLITYAVARLPSGMAVLALLCTGAAVAGAGLPPTAAVLRAQWRALPERTRTSVYAIDGVLLEGAQVIGPLIVSAVAATTSAAAALATSGGLVVLSAAVAAVLLRHAAPSVRRRHSPIGPLRVPSVDLLLIVIVLVIAAIAVVEVSVVAFAHARDRPALAGLMFAAMAAGSAAGGVIFAVRGSRRPARALVAPLCLVSAAGFALLLLGRDNTPILFAALVVSNLAVSPTFATLFSALGDATPRDEAAETFTWATSANYLAISIGTGVGGELITHASLGTAFVAAVGLFAAAAGVASLTHRLTASAAPAMPHELNPDPTPSG